MQDDKRRERQLKRDIKLRGTRRRRRFLKDLVNEPDDFDFGAEQSQVFNQPRRRREGLDEEFE